MIPLAIALLTIGSFGIGAAVIMEVKTREKKYKIMMKVFPWFLGMGAVILALAIAGW